MGPFLLSQYQQIPNKPRFQSKKYFSTGREVRVLGPEDGSATQKINLGVARCGCKQLAQAVRHIQGKEGIGGLHQLESVACSLPPLFAKRRGRSWELVKEQEE